MTPRERGVVAAVLLLIALLVAADVASDLRQGASAWHVLLEVLAGGLAVAGALYLLHGTLQLRQRLARQARSLQQKRKRRPHRGAVHAIAKSEWLRPLRK